MNKKPYGASTKKVRAYLKKFPNAKPKEVAEKLAINIHTVYYVFKAVREKVGVIVPTKRKPEVVAFLAETSSPPRPKARMATADDYIKSDVADKVDYINHPPHYKVGGIETIDFIEAKKLSYNLGNAVKYITRADHKENRQQDLEKARWYIEREILRAHIN